MRVSVLDGERNAACPHPNERLPPGGDRAGLKQVYCLDVDVNRILCPRSRWCIVPDARITALII